MSNNDINKQYMYDVLNSLATCINDMTNQDMSFYAKDETMRIIKSAMKKCSDSNN